MITAIDFSECELNRKYYGGFERKEGKSSYFEVINSLQFEACNDALRYIMSHLDMHEMEKLIDETPLISEVQRTFYKHIITERYHKILLESFEKLKLRG